MSCEYPASQDNLRVVAEHLGLVSEIVGINTDAMTANQSRAKGQEIPFGAGCLQDFNGINADLVENHRIGWHAAVQLELERLDG